MYHIKKMSQDSAEAIAQQWQYPGEYAFYDMTADPEDYKELVTSELRQENYFEVLEKGQLIGFFCIDLQEEQTCEFGLGLRPDLTGKGFGKVFLAEILQFIQEQYGIRNFKLAVATFNQRAIRLYEQTGFRSLEIYQQATNGGHYEFLRMEKNI